MSMAEVQAFFEKQAALWDYSSDQNKLEEIRFFFRKYFNNLPGPVLDLGCGTGVLLKVIPQFLADPPSLILEVDIAKGMLQQVLKKARTQHSPVLAIQADAHHLPLGTQSLGTVIAFQVFPHFLSPDHVLQEIFRVLKHGGRFLILHLMDHEQLNRLHRAADRAVADHYLPPVEQLAEQVQKHGFDIETYFEEKDGYLISARRC